MATTPRRPKAVRMDDETVTVAPLPVYEPAKPDGAADPLEPVPEPRRGFAWFRAFAVLFGAILSLAFGLWIDGLIRDLFAYAPALGWFGLGLAVLLALVILGFVWREIAAISRQSLIDNIRQRAQQAIASDDRAQGLSVVDTLIRFFSHRPETAQGRAKLKDLRHDIIDGGALIGLAENHLLAPLDEQGVRLVTNAAKRVSIVTAVSPRAIIDIGYVLFESVRLIRVTSQIYGGRPGFFGFLRLTRSVIAHLAVTGGVAVGDTLLQQVLGTSLASRISARLGEGVLNGFLTARIGLSALDLCRPLPFSKSTQPTLAQVMGSILSTRDEGAEGT